MSMGGRADLRGPCSRPPTYDDAKTRPPSSRALRDAVPAPLLMALWVHNYSVYGRRKLWKVARRAGHDVGRDQVARLMAAQGMRGASRAKRRFTTKPDTTHLRAPDLVKRNFTASRPDTLWVADVQCRCRGTISITV